MADAFICDLTGKTHAGVGKREVDVEVGPDIRARVRLYFRTDKNTFADGVIGPDAEALLAKALAGIAPKK